MSTRDRRNMRHAQSALQIYLQEINLTPLLNAAQERELASRIALGDPEARDRMVQSNLRLVVTIARGYLGKGLGLEDLVEEGNLGLMRAVEGFDGSMEVRFSTYATYWIKQSIRRAVMNQGKPIRLPAYMVTLLSKWRRAGAVLTEQLGRAPSPEEIGKAMRLSKKKMAIVAKALRVNNLTTPADAPDEDPVVLDEMLTDDRSKSAADVILEADDLEMVWRQMDMLDERELAVIRMRYGLEDDQPRTLREIGENLGLTRERVRQLEQQARLKLGGALARAGA